VREDRKEGEKPSKGESLRNSDWRFSHDSSPPRECGFLGRPAEKPNRKKRQLNNQRGPLTWACPAWELTRFGKIKSNPFCGYRVRLGGHSVSEGNLSPLPPKEPVLAVVIGGGKGLLRAGRRRGGGYCTDS